MLAAAQEAAVHLAGGIFRLLIRSYNGGCLCHTFKLLNLKLSTETLVLAKARHRLRGNPRSLLR